VRIIIAPDKYKGSLTAKEACEAIRKGIKDIYPETETIELPMADGGNGTAFILAEASGGKMISCNVHDPLNRIISSSFGISGDGKTAFVEMAAASGIQLLLPEERNCYYTSTFGTGELILAAMNKAAQKIILCIGGSATNDAGIGMAAALGYQFMDSDDNLLEPIGKNLQFIHRIDDSNAHTSLRKIEFEVACDVDNPLAGPNGAAWIYGPQKGANECELRQLNKGLEQFAFVVQEKYSVSVLNIPGSGAAGGLGAGAIIFLHAKLRRGIEIVLNFLCFEKLLKSSNLIITGEGKLDSQSLNGKVIQGIAQLAAAYKIPVIAIAGSVELTEDEIKKCGLFKTYSITPEGTPLEIAIKEASANLRSTAGKMALENF